MAGHISFVMKAKFPYTPGLDICGIVEQVGDKCKQFKAGDRVIAVLPASNHAGMAEFARVDEQYVAPWPSTLSSLEAAGLPTAGCTAYDAFQNAKLPEGAKVIVLGASGGVGTLLVQLLRNAGASFIAATSTNATLVQSLGAHQVIDYRSSKWYQVLENKQLDAVFDCVGDRESWFNSHRALHRKGRYIAVTESPDAQICGIGDLLGFIGRALWRTLSPFSPKYVVITSFPTAKQLLPLVAQAKEGKLRPVLDPHSPYELTTQDVRNMVQLQGSHRAKGKLVVQIAEDQ